MTEILNQAISVDEDGNLLLKTGTTGNPLTQLGARENKFIPYKRRVDQTEVIYCYDIENEFVPQQLNSSQELIDAIRGQAGNEMITGYMEMAGENLYEFMAQFDFMSKNTMFVKLNNGYDTTDIFFDKLTEMINDVIPNVIEVKPSVSAEELSVSEDAPPEVKEYLEPILSELQEVDSYYSFSDIDIEEKFMPYITGFVDIDFTELQNYSPDKINICLVTDFFNSGYLLKNSIHLLNKQRYNVGLCIATGHYD